MNEFERLTDEVVLIDGKYYRAMTDKEVADFIWASVEVDEKNRELNQQLSNLEVEDGQQ